jgi:hypothetical protein
MVHPRLVLVDLPKDRRPEVYRSCPSSMRIIGSSSTTRIRLACVAVASLSVEEFVQQLLERIFFPRLAAAVVSK